jgi:hypothetical protein
MIRCGWEQIEIKATGAICPVPGCETLTIAYRTASNGATAQDDEPCEFICNQCGFEFTASGNGI